MSDHMRELIENSSLGTPSAKRHAFDLPLLAPPMTSNQARGAHWTKIRAARNEVGWRVKAAARGLPRITRCRVHVTWHAPDHGTRDAGSLTVFGKAAIDELVRMGVLVKDNAEHVLSETYEIEQGSDNPRITITITEED